MSFPEQRAWALGLTPAKTLPERARAVVAFLALVFIDVVMKLAGFRRFHGMVKRWPLRVPARDDAETISAICAAVDRASVYYFKRAWCLQRSATAVCLLRSRGVDAHLIIGVEKFPFYAHAWVEVDGKVVNDSPQVQRRFTVIERC